jgi:hypothetical protein
MRYRRKLLKTNCSKSGAPKATILELPFEICISPAIRTPNLLGAHLPSEPGANGMAARAPENEPAPQPLARCQAGLQLRRARTLWPALGAKEGYAAWALYLRPPPPQAVLFHTRPPPPEICGSMPRSRSLCSARPGNHQKRPTETRFVGSLVQASVRILGHAIAFYEPHGLDVTERILRCGRQRTLRIFLYVEPFRRATIH